MVYEYACCGQPLFDGYVPISGALGAPLDGECTNQPIGISHLQGTEDVSRWPRTSDLNPGSSHL